MNDRELIRRIGSIIGEENCQDDCAVFPSPDGIEVISTDMLHERTDFPQGMSDWQIGWMTAAVTISDIAAMGAEPQILTVALGLDREERLSGIVQGIHDCCRKYSARYAGGDLDAHSELTLVSTGLGLIRSGKPVLRSGAAPGDLLCVTGVLGRAQAALDGYTQYWKKLCEPQPRVSEAGLLREAGASAMMDISDGLALSLYDLMEASGMGCRIERSLLPKIGDIPAELADKYALYGGGDFELLFAIRPERLPSGDLPITRIGTVSAERGVLVDGEVLDPKGYSHQW